MGRKSVRENKNRYQTSREYADLTREKASELMEYVSAERIEKIESEKAVPHADEVIAMSSAYNDSLLCNYFCSHECPIGAKYVPEITPNNLTNITLQIVNSINLLEKKKNRLIEIAVDGKISDDEVNDFRDIKEELSKIAMSISTLQIWVEDMEKNIKEN